MATTTHLSPAAFSYAQALLELAGDQQAEPIGQDLDALTEVVRTNPTFKAYLSDPSISQIERMGKLKSILSGQVSPLLMNFIGVLNNKNRLGMLSEIAGAYKQLLDRKLNKIEVEVTVAKELPGDQLQLVQQQVSSALKKNAVVKQKVDDSIIGGLVIKVQDQLIDASVRSQLNAMKQQLLASRT
jgi:F-type H+-transporting ATPase subunit delta